MLTLNAQIPQVACGNQCALHETDDEKDDISSQIYLMRLDTSHAVQTLFRHGYLEHCHKHDAANPNREGGIERSHGGAVVVNLVNLMGFQRNRRRKKGGERVLVVAEQRL